MIVSLSVVRYRAIFIPFALLAMAIHRIPLALNRKCTFWKLMGCGKNGTFDLYPDWRQWALVATWDSQQDFDSFNNNSFIQKWWKLFTLEKWTALCEPLSSHGKWDDEEPFKSPDTSLDYNGPIAVLTRATIRLPKLLRFWKNVASVADLMAGSPGYITSIGIGEAPFIRQATFSVWDSTENMKAFAYGSKEHIEVIRKTRQDNWYSEELFARFRILSSSGTLCHKDPLEKLNNTN
ncbi:MAG: DUF3291 domain-containing protein [Daejeonella sp.]